MTYVTEHGVPYPSTVEPVLARGDAGQDPISVEQAMGDTIPNSTPGSRIRVMSLVESLASEIGIVSLYLSPAPVPIHMTSDTEH